MSNQLATVIRDRLPSMDKAQLQKLMDLAAGIEVFSSADQIGGDRRNANAILLADNLTTEEVYQVLNQKGCNHVVQSGRSDALFELVLSAVLCKRPDDFIKLDSSFLLQKFVDQSRQALKSQVFGFSSQKDKSDILSRVEAFLATNSALKNLAPRIVQIADELIMNAIFNAPIGLGGKRPFVGLPRTEPVSYPSSTREAKLKIHFDDKHVLIGCEDPWGSLDEVDLREHLSRVTRDSGPIAARMDRPGSGLGLKMIVDASTSFYVLVRKDVMTAIYCGFDLGLSFKKIEETPKHAHLVFLGSK